MPSRGVLFSLLALVIINTKMVRSVQQLHAPTPPPTPPSSDSLAQLGASCLRRSSLPPLVPFIAGDIGYSSIQQASLLGAFFPCVPALFRSTGGVSCWGGCCC